MCSYIHQLIHHQYAIHCICMLQDPISRLKSTVHFIPSFSLNAATKALNLSIWFVCMSGRDFFI